MDSGRSGIKAATGSERVFGLPVIAELPADADWRNRGSLDKLVRANGTIYLESWCLGYDHRDWLVGERVERLGLPGRYAMTVNKADANTRLLILAAVTALTDAPAAEVCVGLPLHQFEREGPAMRELLRGPHVVRARGGEYQVTLQGTVVPEGLGLWVRSVTPVDGPDPDLIARPTVVLDLGHRTVQCSVYTGLRVLPMPYVSAHGSYEVWEAALIQRLEEGPGGTVYESPQRAAIAARLLREGVVTIRGQRVTLTELQPFLRAAAGRIWPRIREEILRMLEQVPYERVVAGGGGVHLFGPYIRELFGPEAVLLEDRFAQAEGYRLYLEHRDRLQRAA
jgi:hypothetical protein